MIFAFNDRSKYLTHLGFIMCARKASENSLIITINMVRGMLNEIALQYKTASSVDTDLRRLHSDLQKYSDIVHKIEQEAKIGFATSAVGGEEEPEPEDS